MFVLSNLLENGRLDSYSRNVYIDMNDMIMKTTKYVGCLYLSITPLLGL